MQEASSNHGLKRELGLRDLVPMQILLVVGLTWAGNAAKQGETHLWFWLAGVLLLFVPLAMVVSWCVTLWPLEGGVYQWTKYAMGPFAGFMSAWNVGLWAMLTVSAIGVLTATSLSYGLGPKASWMQESHWLIAALTIGIFLLMLLVNVPGFGIGRWVSHFGTTGTLLVTFLLLALLFWHPHTSAAHPHVSPQKPFGFALPAITLVSVNLFTKITFNALTGLEQVAVFAGEARDPGRAIMRSAWIAAPLIIVIYVLMTGAMLTYTPSAKIDLAGPIPQVIAAAFGGGNGAGSGVDWGVLLGRGTILMLATSVVAQFAVIVAETSRLPLVAGWDGIVPAWFTRLDPRWKTPTRSLLVIVLVCIGMGLISIVGTGAQEAFQLLVGAANILYGVNYLLMFAIPLVVGRRFASTPGVWVKLAAVSGFSVTLLAMGFNLLPIVDVTSRLAFALKVGGVAALLNGIGMLLYWRGTRSGVAAIVG